MSSNIKGNTTALRNLALMVFALGALAFFSWYVFANRTKPIVAEFWTYKDSVNKIAFTLPVRWRPMTSQNFVKVFSNPDKQEELNVLIKINPMEPALEYFKLVGDSAEKIIVGGRELTISHSEESLLGDSGEPIGTLTFTRLYFKDVDGRGYMFEITPAQKEGMNKGMEKIVSTLRAI